MKNIIIISDPLNGVSSPNIYKEISDVMKIYIESLYSEVDIMTIKEISDLNNEKRIINSIIFIHGNVEQQTWMLSLMNNIKQIFIYSHNEPAFPVSNNTLWIKKEQLIRDTQLIVSLS